VANAFLYFCIYQLIFDKYWNKLVVDYLTSNQDAWVRFPVPVFPFENGANFFASLAQLVRATAL